MVNNHLNDDSIQDYLDGTIPPNRKSDIQQHLQACQLCRDAMASYQDVYLALEHESEFELSKNFTRRVLRQTHKHAVGSLQFGLTQIFLSLAAIIVVINVVLTYGQVDAFTGTAKTTYNALEGLIPELTTPLGEVFSKLHFGGFYVVLTVIGFLGLVLLDRFVLQPRFKQPSRRISLNGY